MKKTQEFIAANKDRFLDELFELLRIPSISANSEHAADMDRAAEWIKASLIKAGVDRAEIFPTEGPSIVYGEKIIDPSKPTVLVYAHYDVMPTDPEELWTTSPFEPVVKDGRIYARGADDDKGQGFMHIAAFEAMVASGELPCNVKFMLEGEEEIGSGALTKWCEANKELLAADIILVSDTSMLSLETPSITCGLRGLAFIELEVTGPNRDLHSGLYGGAVANPINVICDMISKTLDDDGRLTVEGFYDGIYDFTAEERAEIAKAPFSDDEFKESINIGDICGETGYSTVERRGIRPTFDVCGIWGGYIGEGAKTVIPSIATAKISTRLVAGQDYKHITKLLTAHFERIAPKSVKIKVTPSHGGSPYISPTDTKAYTSASAAIEATFGKKPLPFYSGGSIPIIATFERILGIKSILMGFGLDSDAIHSPNENFKLDCFYKGIETIPYFYKEFSK